ncbi:hypothetical protein ACU686_34585 [Yinghuangia aomiensis]
MASFDTPEPISVAADFDAGTLRLVAHDGRATTTVEVRPANPARDIDVKAAEQTTVDFAHGTLTVKCPKQRRSFRRSGVVEVTIDLPAGSRVVGNTSMGDLIADGTLGDVRFKTSMGDVRVDRTGALHAESSYGAISAEHSRRRSVRQHRDRHRGPRRGGRPGGRQERQRRHPPRPCARRTAGQGVQRRDRRRPGRQQRRREELQRRRADRRRRPRQRRPRDRARRHRDRHPQGHRRLARRRLALRHRAQHVVRPPTPPPRATPPSRSAPGPHWGTCTIRRA